MKWQYIHEDHKRQDKTRSEHYRHSMAEFTSPRTGKPAYDPWAKARWYKHYVKLDTTSESARMHRRMRMLVHFLEHLSTVRLRVNGMLCWKSITPDEFAKANGLAFNGSSTLFQAVMTEIEAKWELVERRAKYAKPEHSREIDETTGQEHEVLTLSVKLDDLFTLDDSQPISP